MKRRRNQYGVESKESWGTKPVGTSPGPYRTKKFAWDPFGTWPSYTVESIHHVMLVRGETRYHVQWKDIPETGWTWEPESNLQDNHSRAVLEAFKAAKARQETVRRRCLLQVNHFNRVVECLRDVGACKVCALGWLGWAKLWRGSRVPECARHRCGSIFSVSRGFTCQYSIGKATMKRYHLNEMS
jgi:hypothetical protein